MVKVITRDWGCLMPGYDHAGSGWWRARPLQCAQAGSILIGDDTELRVYYGDEYPFYGLTGAHLPECSDRLLAEVARCQHDLLLTYHPLNRKQQQIELEAVLDAAG